MANPLRRRLLVLVAAIGFLAGCTSGFGEASKTAALLLGDFSTIEPCSLTDPEVFAEFGNVEFGQPRSLDFCAVVIKPNADPDADVTIEVGELGRANADYLETPLPRKLEYVADSIYITELDDRGGDSCWQMLVFEEEDLTLSVRGGFGYGRGYGYGEVAPVSPCDLVAAGMAKAVEVVLAEKVEHRSPEPNSLVSLDPCDLVSDETITTLPGFAAAQRTESPGGHQCRWHTPSAPPDGPLRVTVTFDVGKMPKSLESQGIPSKSSTIAGRPAVALPMVEKSCRVETGHIPFDEVEGTTDIFETVDVYADMPPGQRDAARQLDMDEREDAACEGAIAVATALWPRLPSA